MPQFWMLRHRDQHACKARISDVTRPPNEFVTRLEVKNTIVCEKRSPECPESQPQTNRTEIKFRFLIINELDRNRRVIPLILGSIKVRRTPLTKVWRCHTVKCWLLDALATTTHPTSFVSTWDVGLRMMRSDYRDQF